MWENEKLLKYDFKLNLETGDYSIEKYQVFVEKNKFKKIWEEKWNLYSKRIDKEYLKSMEKLSWARMRNVMSGILSELPIYETEGKFILDLNIIK